MSTGNSFDPLNYAHFYISVGLRVVPIWGIDANGNCMCRGGASCTSAGKHPIPSKGFHEATTDRAQLAKWWQAHPNANVGIATSADFTIIDIDVKSGGLATFDAL